MCLQRAVASSSSSARSQRRLRLQSLRLSVSDHTGIDHRATAQAVWRAGNVSEAPQILSALPLGCGWREACVCRGPGGRVPLLRLPL